MNPITRIFRILPATILSGLLLTTASHSVEETSWGSIKDQLTSPAAKPSKNASHTGKKSSNNNGGTHVQTSDSNAVEGDFTASGGHLSVKGGQETTLDFDGIKVMFQVPKGAVPNKVNIDMTVTGNKANNLEVAFGPAGLVFKKTCWLKITLQPSALNIPLHKLQPYHVHGDGTVDDAGIETVTLHDDGSVSIKIAVNGFSRYGLSGGF